MMTKHGSRLRSHLAALLLTLPAFAEEATPAEHVLYLRTHYTKHEYRIAMRDGVRLFTAVYVPKDASETYPILLNRTPYGVSPYGEDAPLDTLEWFQYYIDPTMMKDGYIFALQDVRGRMGSEGEFVHVRPHNAQKRGPQDIDESSDTYDTVDWLVKNVAQSNGRVGVWGISYPGFYSTCAAIDAHPAVKAVSPQAPVTDWFAGDDFRHNGAFFLPHAFNFLAPFTDLRPPTPVRTLDRQWQGFDHGTADGYAYFLGLLPVAEAGNERYGGRVPYWSELHEHDTYDDYWKARNIRNHIRDIRPAVLTVGGWFDAEDLYGALETYRAIEAASPKTDNKLVMGPWVHGEWARDHGDGLGSVRFDAKTAEFYRENILAPFFAHHLKEAPSPGLPEAWVFETGRNQWHAHDAWPPESAVSRALHFHPGGRLAFEPPTAAGHDEYVSDPARPVPFVEDIAIGMLQTYMVADQRFAARRPDVLVFQTEPLEEPVTIAGPIGVRLAVSTTGTDSDFVVKLIDVYPATFPEPAPRAPVPGAPEACPAPPPPPGYSTMGGYQQLVRGEPFRGKFRNGLDRPEPFAPGERATIEFRMPDAYHTFRRGHRIMVQVQSSWFPLVDLNPQTFTRIATADPSEFRRATQRVYHGPAGSSLSLGVVTAGEQDRKK